MTHSGALREGSLARATAPRTSPTQCGGAGSTAVIDSECGESSTCTTFAPPGKESGANFVSMQGCTQCTGAMSGSDEPWICWPSAAAMDACNSLMNSMPGASYGTAVDGVFTCARGSAVAQPPALAGILAMAALAAAFAQ